MAIITVSRGSFAGGKTVAEKVAAQLQYPLLSREQVLEQAARDYGIMIDELRATLNESPGYWQQALGKRLAYVKCVTAVLLDHACHGNLVYHGNVGHLLLAGLPGVIRVRIVANMSYRLAAAMAQSRLTKEEAQAYIERVDSERQRWAQWLYGVDWSDPTQYTLVLNVAELSEATAAETIVRLASVAEFQPTPEGKKQLADMRLSAQVWAAIARNPETRRAGIEVTANDGVVTIRGSAGSTKALELIPQIAKSVDGVSDVQCEAGLGTDWFW